MRISHHNVVRETGGQARAGHKRIALVEGHRLQRLYAESMINAQPDLRVVFADENLASFTRWYLRAGPEERPQLLLLDLHAEGGAPVDPAKVSQLLRSGLLVSVFSAMTSPPLIRQMLRVGVNSFIGKRDPEHDVLAAIRATLNGEEWRSPELAEVMKQDAERPKLGIQEERVLALYASGLKLTEVASSIGVQPGTAKKYLRRVQAKYADIGRPVSSRLELYREATEAGYLSPGARSLRADLKPTHG